MFLFNEFYKLVRKLSSLDSFDNVIKFNGSHKTTINRQKRKSKKRK